MVNVSYNVKKLTFLYDDCKQFYFLFISFTLYFKMYPEGLKYQYPINNSTTSTNSIIPIPLSSNWSLSLKIKRIVSIYSTFLLMLISILTIGWGFPSRGTNVVAWILGIFSMILSVFQFIPQIHQTFKHKVRQVKRDL